MGVREGCYKRRQIASSAALNVKRWNETPHKHTCEEAPVHISVRSEHLRNLSASEFTLVGDIPEPWERGVRQKLLRSGMDRLQLNCVGLSVALEMLLTVSNSDRHIGQRRRISNSLWCTFSHMFDSFIIPWEMTRFHPYISVGCQSRGTRLGIFFFCCG